jgi:hypothetical protein
MCLNSVKPQSVKLHSPAQITVPRAALRDTLHTYARTVREVIERSILKNERGEPERRAT